MKRCLLLLTPLLPPPSLAQAAAAADAPLVLQGTNKTSSHTAQEELRDIHGPLQLPDSPPYLAIAAAVLLALAVLFVCYRLWKRRKKTVAAPPPPPWVEALHLLDEARSLLEAGDSLAYLEKSADILRRYVELRFSLPSTRQTTREFLAGLGGNGASPLHPYRQELQGFLEQADLAKFAHHAGDIGQLAEIEGALRHFIERTTPVAENGGRP